MLADFHFHTTILKKYALRLGLVVFLAFLAAVLLYAKDRAAGPEIQLSITPATLQLAPGQSADVALVVRNPITATLQNLSLTWFSPLNATVTIEPHAVDQLQPGGAQVFKAHITRPEEGLTTGNIFFQLDYSVKPSAGAASLPGVAIASLEIQDPPVEDISRLADIQIEMASGPIDEQHPGLIFLDVHNLASTPITVTQVVTYTPSFIKLDIPPLGRGEVIPPQSTTTLPVPIKVTDSIQTGQQKIAFRVGLSWVKGGRAGSGSLLSVQTVDLAILGESDLLKLVGVPSFLFLPGFLVLTTLLTLLARFTQPKVKPDLSIPEFALISITLSLIASIAYPWITGTFFGAPRDYLYAYGLRDIFQVWFGSVIFGILIWSVWFGGSSLWRRRVHYLEARRLSQEKARRAAEIARYTPQETDDPLQILEKMSLNEVRFPLQVGWVQPDGRSVQAFIVLPPAQDRPTAWVAPPILLTPKKNIQPDAEQYPQRRQALLKQIESAQNPDDLVNILAKATDIWNIGWGEEGPLNNPHEFPEGEIANQAVAQRSFVELA